jgi:proline dehydrogenase
MRAVFLAASENRWLRERGVRAPFVRRAVAQFMPGETFDDMLRVARLMTADGIHTVFTRLGENVSQLAEAQAVADHYVQGIEQIRVAGLSCEPSVKPTQLGLDIERTKARDHLHRIAAAAAASGSYVWVDMEQSPYVDVTLDLVEELRASSPCVGVCLQAYLHRTREDLARLLRAGVGVRLVKGAYREPAAVALAAKPDVDANYLSLGRMMLDDRARGGAARVVFGTHDDRLTRDLIAHARATHLDRGSYEFHMLYGIRRREQLQLAKAREHVRVLIAYGTYWFPWYMRRLAERPANVWFVVKSVFR